MKRIAYLSAAGVALLCLTPPNANAATFFGPLGGTGLSGEYAQASDSPFAALNFTGGYFHLEDYEDGLQNTPGVTSNNGGVTSVVFGPSIHDSVDADDGAIDGSGLGGDSYFSSPGSAGVTWTFSAAILGSLPTHAGIVWTDGSGTITFEAFGAGGASLGTIVGNHATPGNNGETDEDRFYGVFDAGGISAIKLSNSGGGIEADHLQYGRQAGGPQPGIIPLPAGLWLMLSGLGAFGVLRRRG